MATTASLTLLYDGGCPLCLREVNFLRQRDERLHSSSTRIAFVDINDEHYRPEQHQGISYREAMGRIHAIQGNGTVLKDVAVFREAYRLIGLGWLYAPTAWPVIRPLADWAYGLWGPVAPGPNGTPKPGSTLLPPIRSDGGSDALRRGYPTAGSIDPPSARASPQRTAAPRSPSGRSRRSH